MEHFAIKDEKQNTNIHKKWTLNITIIWGQEIDINDSN